MNRLSIITSLAFCALAQVEVEYAANFDWASKYVEQGFETTEDSFYTLSFEAGLNNWSLGLLAGYAPDQDYRETNVSLTYAYTLSDEAEVTFGYTRYDYQEDDSYGNELDLIFYYTPMEELEAYLHFGYNFEVDGVFVESGVSYRYEFDHGFSVTPYALVGFDFDYLTPEFNGGNHVQVGVELAYQVSAESIIYLAAHQSGALENIDREGSGDLFWVNAGVTYEF